MEKVIWERPHLLVLVRTVPEDGVLQLDTCKFPQFGGPGNIDCGPGNQNGGEPGIDENCEQIAQS